MLYIWISPLKWGKTRKRRKKERQREENIKNDQAVLCTYTSCVLILVNANIC